MRPLPICILLSALLAASRADGAIQGTDSNSDHRPAVVIAGYRPEYPYEARRGRITGAGIVVFQIDPSTGNVISCRMDPSTGSSILDEAALYAFRQWFRPGGPAMARSPITFTMSGQVVTPYRVKEKPMDDVLSAFLGRGTVANGPIPAYPHSIPWINKQGKGTYELHVQKDGGVSEVRILKHSGDEVFDKIAVDTLRKWRLRRGPLILELPLAFRLTPAHYSVNIPKDR